MTNTPIRVLHVVGGMDRGGVETLLMNIYRRIDRSRIQFDFAVHTDRTCDYDAEILDLGGRIFRHPTPSDRGVWSFARTFWATLRNEGPFAAVHSHVHHFSGLVLYFASVARIPVRISHSYTTRDGHRNSPSRLAYRWGMLRLIDCFATHLLANSATTFQALYRRRDDPRKSILLPGIDLAEYEKVNDRGTKPFQPPGLPKADLLLGHVGGFRAVKNHRFLLNFFAAFCSNFINARLVLAGDGPLRAEIERHIVALGIENNVHLLGSRADVPEILRGLDLFIFPSLYEGLPHVLIEAQAAGLRCLVSTKVTREADLGLGLLRYVDLDSGIQHWVAEARVALNGIPPGWKSRRIVLSKRGFDIQATAQALETLYLAHTARPSD